MAEMHLLDFRIQSVGGPVVRPRMYLLAEDGREIEVEPGPALNTHPAWTFLIHGFANDRPEGKAKLSAYAAQVRKEAPELDSGLALVLWPGDNLLSPLTYSVEEEDAQSTADQLSDFILEHLPPSIRPHFIAHSLGSLVALETMKRLHGNGVPAGVCLLLAGAVDCDALARRARFQACVQAASRVQVLSSKKDIVLHWCFPIGDLIAGFLFGGYTRSALGRVGPQASEAREGIPGTVASLPLSNDWKVGHGDYLAAADGGMNPKQLSSAHLAAGILTGGPAIYPAPTP